MAGGGHGSGGHGGGGGDGVGGFLGTLFVGFIVIVVAYMVISSIWTGLRTYFFGPPSNVTTSVGYADGGGVVYSTKVLVGAKRVFVTIPNNTCIRGGKGYNLVRIVEKQEERTESGRMNTYGLWLVSKTGTMVTVTFTIYPNASRANHHPKCAEHWK